MAFQTVLLRPSVKVSPGDRYVAMVAVPIARVLVLLRPYQLLWVIRAMQRGVQPASIDGAQASWSAVVGTSAVCAGRDACLQRSVAVVVHCRLRRRRIGWCLGVRSESPFGAHAWVEAEGRPVEEDFGPSALAMLARLE